MSAPRPMVVVLLVAVVVLVGIYALGLGSGLQGSRASLQKVKGWVSEARAMPLDELGRSGACSPAAPGTLRIPAAGTCQLEAEKARPWSRREVVLFSGQRLYVVVTPAEKDGPAVTVDGETDPTGDRAKSPRFSVPSAGATVAVTCNAAAPAKECLLQLIQP